MCFSRFRSLDCLLSFFFFKQKTAYEMRISDWSSDVCSSDLAHGAGSVPGQGHQRQHPVEPVRFLTVKRDFHRTWCWPQRYMRGLSPYTLALGGTGRIARLKLGRVAAGDLYL